MKFQQELRLSVLAVEESMTGNDLLVIKVGPITSPAGNRKKYDELFKF